ncbi:complex I subunit 5 family protein [Fusibacter sp. JL216-2]|uniref:complex I subunit 5 family protein n=1 Tax=Fusibacter sp. JL216-2 TaxID=3071453 RepID=UPI003D358C79
MVLLTFVFLPILIGLLQYIIPFKRRLILALSVQAVLFSCLAYLWFGGNIPHTEYLLATKPPVGMSLKIDALSFGLLLLSTFIFTMLHTFALHAKYYEKKFIFLFMSLQGLIHGVFLSTDFFNVYLLLEVATVVASILIMYKKDRKSINDGMIYLMSNMIAMAFFLMGLGYLYKIFGVLSFDAIAGLRNQHTLQELVLPLAFLLTGISLKSAILPLSSWLPKAHGTASAPIVVSALLSGIFVKTGIYVFIRMQSILIPDGQLNEFFIFIGILTAFAGVLLALIQVDIKLIWAYSTVSQMGWIMLGLNSASPDGFEGATLHIVAHGLYKTTLFLGSGLLVSLYGSRDIHNMKGLMRRAPLVGIPMFIGLLSMTGAPFTVGYASKKLLKYGAGYHFSEWIILGLTVLSATYLIRFMPVLFGKYTPDIQLCPYKVHKSQWLPLWILSGASLFSVFLAYDLGDVSKLLHAIPNYLLILAGGFIVHFLLKQVGEETYHKLRKVDLTFNSLAFMILLVFVALIQFTVHQ